MSDLSRLNLPVACVAALMTFSAGAQIQPGHSIATVTITIAGTPGEMYDIDHQAGTATLLTIAATLAAERPNCVLMLNSSIGFVGTNPLAPAISGNIYGIQVANGVVTENLLNTTPTAGLNVAQLAVLGGNLYFTTQDAGGAVGVLQSIPLGGGPVTAELDLSTIGALGLANAVAVMNSKVYVATFNSSPSNTATTPGELIEFDPVTSMGRIVRMLPSGGFQPNGNPWNTGIVNMHPDPLNPGLLALEGVYGELLCIDPVTAQVVHQVWTGLHNATGNALASGSVNSFSYDPVARDWIIGTRDGHIERWVDGQQAEKKIPGVGSYPVAGNNSVNGLHYFSMPAGFDVSYGPGCGGNDGWKPTDSSFGPPVAGNSAFRFGLFAANGGDPVALLVDFQNVTAGPLVLPFGFGAFGAPACFLRCGNLIALPATAGGAAPGDGQATIAFPIPAGTAGKKLFRQWVELQLTPTNRLGVVFSNARQITVM